MARCNTESCSLDWADYGDETEGRVTAKGRPDHGRNYEGCGPHWASDVYDYTHEYESDWLDRFDDSEGSTRNAFSSLFGNRGGRRRHSEDRPPRALRRGAPTEDILEESGFFETVGSPSLKELAARIESLTKTVEKLAKAQHA